MEHPQQTVRGNLFPWQQAPAYLRLGYVGKCSKGLRTFQVMGLYFDAYQRAQENGLKGMFICDGNKIGSVLEGDHLSVNRVWQMIQSDNRNEHILLFEQNEISIPIYGEWTMHVKDVYILNLMYPECKCPVRDTDNNTTEEVLGMMHTYAAFLRNVN